MANDPADGGQRLQMLGSGVGRRQQQERQVDRLPVDRLIVDWIRQPDDQGIDALQPLDLAMWDRDAIAEARRAEPLALGNGFDDRRRVDAKPCRRKHAEHLQELALVAGRQADADGVEVEKITELHGFGALTKNGHDDAPLVT
jgi:hypothetical protein